MVGVLAGEAARSAVPGSPSICPAVVWHTQQRELHLLKRQPGLANGPQKCSSRQAQAIVAWAGLRHLVAALQCVASRCLGHDCHLEVVVAVAAWRGARAGQAGAVEARKRVARWRSA